MSTEIFFKIILIVIITGFTCSRSSANDSVPNVFINEIHYDNDGADINEGVEVAGPAGTDLSKFKLYFYNGYNNQTYDTLSLSGTIRHESNSYGTKWFAVEGIQNGAPDGIALIFEENGKKTVIQFISYEGTITAEDGPASGTRSSDIGIAEEATQQAGLSLQLTGRGKYYTKFSWTINTATPGVINAGQKLNPPRGTTIVIR